MLLLVGIIGLIVFIHLRASFKQFVAFHLPFSREINVMFILRLTPPILPLILLLWRVVVYLLLIIFFFLLEILLSLLTENVAAVVLLVRWNQKQVLILIGVFECGFWAVNIVLNLVNRGEHRTVLCCAFWPCSVNWCVAQLLVLNLQCWFYITGFMLKLFLFWGRLGVVLIALLRAA